MELSAMNIGFGLIVLVSLGLFMRALLAGSRMIGGMLDRGVARARAGGDRAAERAARGE